MAATIPADIAQYYGCLLRVAQKLLYLYGFPQIEYKENEQAFDTMDSFNVCEMAVCHDLYRAPDTPDALAGGIAFYATSSNSFGIYLCLTSHPLVSVFFTLCRKKSALVACKIYIFLTFAY